MPDEPHTGDMDGMSNASPGEEPGLITIPAFQIGEQAWRSGIAGPQATLPNGIVAAEEDMSQGQVINYYFPIEVEVIGTLNESHLQQVAEYVYDELITALQS